ncbi:Putative glutathione S-transferase, Thioredoxin-like superfamily, glutathione Transferase family [Septoria linicola]|uniref:Glutathione S-transferase, Thioredoxin-like superfamily, glutathione Transferase family n=1 Tax=Septoria linicola TaxID=215465 RepID=A0A9Q9AJQ3_9PEZI|nr:Putative glutathione S-transferase, Thioredoxin-like superfamily, glutathione Transferase family [Septoria linicola]
MTITLHHLGISQSERNVWLLEELGLEYKLVHHTRDPVMAPESLKSVPGNETWKSPFIEDDQAKVTLSESAAIMEYIIQRYGRGKFALKPDDKHYADYLYWFHYANGTLQANMVTSMFLAAAQLSPDIMIQQFADQRLHAGVKLMDDRLKDNKWLAGDEFTAADMISLYSVTTQRYFGPLVNLAPYSNLLRWIQDCAARPAYQRAMEKGDPEMKPLTSAEAPTKGLMETGGTAGDSWKK